MSPDAGKDITKKNVIINNILKSTHVAYTCNYFLIKKNMKVLMMMKMIPLLRIKYYY